MGSKSHPTPTTIIKFLWPLKHSLSSLSLLTCVPQLLVFIKKLLVSYSNDHCVLVMLIECIAPGDLASFSVMLMTDPPFSALALSHLDFTIWYEVKGSWGVGRSRPSN